MNLGGPAVQVSGLLREIDQNKFNQRLYTGFCAPEEEDYLRNIAPDIAALRVKGLGRRINFIDDIRALTLLIKAIHEFKPHIIHTHTAKAGILGRIASIMSLHPSIRVHTFHGHLLIGYFGRNMRLFVILIERVLAIFTDYLLAVGSKVRYDLLKVGIGSQYRFGLMFPGLRIEALPEKSVSQKSLGLDTNKLQCAFIGRVTRIKRPDRFLDIVLEIKKRGIELNFFIAGDGELLKECRKIILEKNLQVTVLGWQNSIEKVLSAADIVILTSDNEGMPLSLIQAGMSGLPVIATDVGSVSEVVLDKITGLVTSGDIIEMADALESLAKNKDLRMKLGQSAQEFTLKNFGIRRLVTNHETLYKQLLSNQARF
jgi:glycosyltransferase involved in cell wall biosynthesis